MLLIPNDAFSVVLYTFFLEYSSNPFIGYNDKILHEFEELEIPFLTVTNISILPAFEMLNSCVLCEVMLFVCMVLLIWISSMTQFQVRPTLCP